MSLIECIQDQASYYQSLTAELDQEANINSQLENAQDIRQQLGQAIERKKSEINSLEQYSKKEFRDVRKMRHLSFRSAAATISGKKKELTAKEEAKYQLAFENEQRSKRELEDLQTNYNAALAQEEELVQQKSHFDEVKMQYESLLDQIFASDTHPNFPMEPQLKAELANYEEQRLLATRDQYRFKEADTALNAAFIETKKVIRLLDTVVNYVPFEIFGGPIIDDEQVAYLDAAKKRIWEVQRLLNIARTVLPEIPYPQTLDVVTHNPLLQMQLNLNYIDIAWKAKTTQCFGMLATVYRNIQNSKTWVKQYKDYATGAVIRLNEAVDNMKQSLGNERRRIIDTVLAGNMGNPTSTSFAGNYDLPPPVYEAPPADNQQQEVPAIPSNMSPTSSNNSSGNLIDATDTSSATVASPALLNVSAPPQPITPVMGNTTISPILDSNTALTNQTNEQVHHQPYKTHNVNNPFQ